MPTITLSSIIAVLGDSAGNRNNKAKWSAEFVNMETGDKTTATVEDVKLEPTGLMLKLKHNGSTTKVEAKPASLSKTKVFVDGDHDPEAAMVFAHKGNLGNMTRWAFDFRPVTVTNDEFRINTRFDP
jgi:hypothetical protein